MINRNLKISQRKKIPYVQKNKDEDGTRFLVRNNVSEKVVEQNIERTERKNCQPKVPCILNIPFKNKGKIKIFFQTY